MLFLPKQKFLSDFCLSKVKNICQWDGLELSLGKGKVFESSLLMSSQSKQ